jgi:shikimate kinase
MFENQELNLDRKIIFLTGFMGSGKSTLGKKLAELLNYEFIDSDDWIEKKQGKSISTIFLEKSESYFREFEIEFIQHLNLTKPSVISTGGGLPCFNDLMDIIKSKGLVIFLKASSEVILQRLKHEKSRPLIQNLKENELNTYIKNKLKERGVYYDKAHITIDADKGIDDLLIELKCILT